MIVPLVEWARDILTDAVTGVNAQLPHVPRGAEDPPAAVTIVNELDDDWVATGNIPRDELIDGAKHARPLLVVRLHPDPQGFRIQALPEYDQHDPAIVPLMLIYACRRIEAVAGTPTRTSQLRDARQVLRTAVRVFAQQFASTSTAIDRHDCTITLPSAGFILNSSFVEPTDDLVLDSLVSSFRVQDRWALGLVDP